MRLLIAHNVSRHHPGGMSRIMEFLHRPLCAAGYEVSTFCSEDVPPAARGRLGRFAFPWLVRRQVARAAAAGMPYDIVNVHEPQSAMVAALRSGLGNPAVVVTSHGVEQRAWELALDEKRLGRGGPSAASRAWYPLTSLWQSRVGLRHADAIFCLSSEDRAYLQDRLGIPGAKITRIFPGADLVFARAAAGRQYEKANQLLFAGTWRKNKGIQDLVPAFCALAERHPDLRLTVLGAGVPRAVVERAFPPAVRQRVDLVSTTTDEETAQVFASADLFVLPSLFEGTPLTLMEAMMSGLPIVTTATCGMKDVVRDGVTGLLVPLRSPQRLVEAIERLRAASQLREGLGRQAQAEALRSYTWDRVAEVVRSAYEALLSHRRRRVRP